MKAAAVVMLFAASLASAQPPVNPAAVEKPLAFEIVSVRANHSGSGNSKWQVTADGLVMTNVPLTVVIQSAYGLHYQEQLLNLPEWAKTETFDIDAKVSPDDIKQFHDQKFEQTFAMLQTVLKDRFHLVAHPQLKELPIYELVTMKNDAKLTPATASQDGVWSTGSGHIVGHGITVATLGEILMATLDRTVVDKSGLTEKYDIDLKWTPDEDAASASSSDGPSVFTAVQEQLGLKLVPAKGPVECIAIDHIERPTAN